MEVNICHTADWHLGHGRTRAADTAQAIRKYLFPVIPKVQMLTLVGDITDNVMPLSSNSAKELSALFIDLFFLTAKYKVVVRIVRGTILHDRTHLTYLKNLLRKLHITLDIKFIDRPCVEFIKPLNASFLYLPDDLPFKNKRALFRHVDKLLVSTGGEVDYVLCHGMFDFTCDGFKLPDTYAVEDFSFCKYRVLAGHIHTPRVRGKVVYSGSFDRLAQNEEHAKGFYVLSPAPKFVKNPDAIIYKTITYSESDAEKLFAKHTAMINRVFKGREYGYLRVFLDDVQLRQALKSFHLRQFPHIQMVTKHTKSPKNTAQLAFFAEKADVALESPSSANLPKLIYHHLKSAQIKLPMERISEVLDGN